MLKARQIAFLTVLVLVADVWGQSQRAPSHGRERSQTQSQPKESQQAPTADQRGTDKMPFSVKITPTRESEEKAAADAKTREEKMELDRKLVNFNGDLAYYTKVLVWVAGLQFIALIVQCVVFALTLGATRKAANAAKTAAEAAILNADAFMASESAQLWMDEVRIHGIRTAPTALKMTYTIRNSARSPGFVHHTPARFFYGTALPEERDLDQTETPVTMFVPSNHFVSADAPLVVWPKPIIDVLLAPNPTTFLFVYGSINYRDIFRKERRAGFAYKIVFGESDISESFPMAGGPAYWDYQ